jgi:hypothetical protein
MEIKDIMELLKNYGLGTTIVVVFICLIFISIKSKWFGDFFSKISDRFVEHVMKSKTKEPPTVSPAKSITESDIINHDIFNYIDFWIYSKIPTFNFSTEYRTVVFRKYLTIYLKGYKDNLAEYINNKQYQTMDESQIWKSMLALINDIIFDYEKEMNNSNLPKVVIEKMKSKNNDTITLTIDLVEGICNSRFYASDKNLLKIYSILNIVLSILENTISNSEHVCNSINGQLKGLTFEGKIEP